MADNQFQVQPQSGSTTGDATSILTQLKEALIGGEAVQDFFAGNLFALNNLYQTIATSGDEVWLDIDVNGDENTPGLVVQNGNNAILVSGQLNDTDTLQNGTGDSTNFKVVGAVSVTLGTTQGDSIVMVHDIMYAGQGIGALALTPAALKLVIKPILNSMKTFLQNLTKAIFNKVNGGETTDDPEDAEDQVDTETENSADASGETGAVIGEDGGEEVAADVALTGFETFGAVVGVGVLAVVLILDLLETPMTNYVRFYNVTAETLNFGVCWMDGSTGASVAPAQVGQTVVVSKIAQGQTPFGPSDEQVITRGDAQFVNNNTLSDIGYVLNAEPVDDFPGFRIVIYIPIGSPNILYAEFSDNDCQTVFNSQMANVNNQVLTLTITSGKYTLSIATNALSGKSADPVSGADGFFYEHLIVLTDGTVPLG